MMLDIHGTEARCYYILEAVITFTENFTFTESKSWSKYSVL